MYRSVYSNDLRRAETLAFALGICAIIGVAVAPPAIAQAAGPASMRRVSIPAQSLATAVAAFSASTGVQVSASPDILQGHSSAAVDGVYSPADALSRLLAGSGITYRFTGPSTVVLEAIPRTADGAIALGPVRVEAGGGNAAAPSTSVAGNLAPVFGGGQVARGGEVGILGERSVFDTPFSVVPFTAQALQDSQARKVSDVLENDPSIQSAFPSASFSDTISIRGLQIFPVEYAINGIFGVAPSFVSTTEYVERVELFKGPNAFLNGYSPYGSVGGSVNMVTKHALRDAPVTQATVNYASRAQFGASADVGRRFGSDQQWGVRLNAGYRDGDTSTDHQSERLAVVQAGLDYHSGALRIDGDLIYQHQHMTSPLSQVYYDFGGPLPKPPKATANYQQRWEYSGSDEYIGLLSIEYDVASNVTIFAKGGYKDGELVQLRDIPFNYQPNGDFTGQPYFGTSFNKTYTAVAGVRSDFATGPVRHKLNVSATYLHFDSGDQLGQIPDPYQSNLYNTPDVPKPPFQPLSDFPTVKDFAVRLKSIAVSDTLSAFDERVQLTLGPRYQQVEVLGYDIVSGDLTQSYNRHAVTPAAALLVKPLSKVSVYGSYIEGLSQGPTAPQGTANEGQIFPPQKSKQIEVGAKYDGGGYGVTLAAYRIDQPSGRTVNQGGPLPVFIVDGQQRNKGVELSIFGEPLHGVRLLGGVAYLDAVLRKTQDGALDGATASGSPKWSVNIGGEWDTPFVEGLTLNGRVHYGSTQVYYDNVNTIPGFTVFDAGAHYALTIGGKSVTLRADVTNVLNKSYWASAFNGLLLGAPRTFLLSTTINF